MKNIKLSFIYLSALMLPFVSSMFSTTHISCVMAAVDKKYLSQGTIDSMVQRGVFVMMASEEVAGFGNRQQQALEGAKTIARNLRIIARTDPNSRYILWRVSELETEILLQEHGLKMENQNKKQKEVNQLVASFNAETARKRPDLRILFDICTKTEALDPNKSDELKELATKRGVDLTREIVGFLEVYLRDSKLDKAQENIDYCEKFKPFMPLSQTKYSQYVSQFKSNLSVKDERAIARTSVQRAGQLRLALSFGEAEAALESASKILARQTASGQSSSEVAKVNSMVSAERVRLTASEDSIVGVALGLLHDAGLMAGFEYLDKTLRPTGLPREKIALIDNALLQKALEMKRETESNIENKDVVAFIPVDVDGWAFLNDLMGSARGRAQQKTDSLRIITLTQDLATLKKRRGSYSRQDYDAREKELFSELSTLNAARIYALVEKKKQKEAADLFARNKKDFQKYMCKEAFESVASAVAD